MGLCECAEVRCSSHLPGECGNMSDVCIPGSVHDWRLCSLCEKIFRQVTARSPEIRQIEIAVWHKDQEPVSEAPREKFGVMQDTLEATLAFAAEAIRSHWNGECDCQRKQE